MEITNEQFVKLIAGNDIPENGLVYIQSPQIYYDDEDGCSESRLVFKDINSGNYYAKEYIYENTASQRRIEVEDLSGEPKDPGNEWGDDETIEPFDIKCERVYRRVQTICTYERIIERRWATSPIQHLA